MTVAVIIEETKRLIIREFEKENFNDFYDMMKDEDVMHFSKSGK